MFLSFGVSKEEFMDSTPNELKPYLEAHNILQRRTDAQMWQMGIYTLNAVSVAVSRALSGRKSHAEYMSKPMYMLTEEQQQEAQMTDVEKFQTWAVAFNTKNFEQGQEGS